MRRRVRNIVVVAALVGLGGLIARLAVGPLAFVVVRVELVDGASTRDVDVVTQWPIPFSGDGALMQRSVMIAVDGLGTRDQRSGPWAARIPGGGGRAVLALRPGTRAGIAAFDARHGLAEVALDLQPAGWLLPWSVTSVTLRLPEARPLAHVDVHVSFPADPGRPEVEGAEDETRSWCSYSIAVRAPVTGITVARALLKGTALEGLALPAGHYALGITSTSLMLCGSHPPQFHEYIDASYALALEPGARRAVEHRFAYGGRLTIDATVRGREAELARDALDLARRIDRLDTERDLFDGRDGFDGAWLALARLERRADPGSTFTPTFTSLGRTNLAPRAHFALGLRAEMLEQLPPGEYELTISGPRVAPWSTTVRLTGGGAATTVAAVLTPR